MMTMTANVDPITVTTADVRCLAGAMKLRINARDLGRRIRLVGTRQDVAAMWGALVTLGCTDVLGRTELRASGPADRCEAVAYKPGVVVRVG